MYAICGWQRQVRAWFFNVKYESGSSLADFAWSGKDCLVKEKENSGNVIENKLEHGLINIELLDYEALLNYSRMLGKLVKRLRPRIPVAVEDIRDIPQDLVNIPKI